MTGSESESKIYIPEVRLLRATDDSLKELERRVSSGELTSTHDFIRVDILKFVDMNFNYLNHNKYYANFIMFHHDEEKIDDKIIYRLIQNKQTYHIFAANELGHWGISRLVEKYYENSKIFECDVLGGGQIDIDISQRSLKIWGESSTYGRDWNRKRARLLFERFVSNKFSQIERLEVEER